MNADTTENRTPRKRVYKAAAAAAATASAAACISLSVMSSAQAADPPLYKQWEIFGTAFRTYDEAYRDIPKTDQECYDQGGGVVATSGVDSGYFIPNLRALAYHAVTTCKAVLEEAPAPTPGPQPT